MKKIRNDLTGKIFGRLKVVKVDEKSGRKTRWICICECGNTKSIRSDCLLGGQVRSCGCLKKEQDKENLTKHHRHLESKTRLYYEWQRLKGRCNNKKNERYYRYGGRGIKVCEEWQKSYENFRDWALENGYKENLTIDRINNNGNYEPKNCRWATIKQQCNNRSTNIIVEYKNKKITLMQLSEIVKIKYATLNQRYSRGDRGKRLIRKVRKTYANTEVSL